MVPNDWSRGQRKHEIPSSQEATFVRQIASLYRLSTQLESKVWYWKPFDFSSFNYATNTYSILKKQ